ncbi:DUF421 domain-containing protein [Sphingobacterium sp. LRF_L2]|uniref:DUF421 domain-containing protein n=1 Tax=Sphingobacterium sp. LRF_L2 TaxID=3369421 RepID=UPI003F6461F3
MGELEKMLLEGAKIEFLSEIVGRTIFMFLLILAILRLSGRRGVRQLTLFEVAIIISLGSAAGDPMFQEDIPILYSVIVFICVMGVYKLITWFTARFSFVANALEGKVMTVVKDGMFDIKHENDHDFSKMEFFAEFRNQSVEHLGQVKEGILEVDGTMSILFYPEEDIQFGLPLFPSTYVEINVDLHAGPFACMYCGNIVHSFQNESKRCSRCERATWTKAIKTKRH